jgi:hypothetical protein
VLQIRIRGLCLPCEPRRWLDQFRFPDRGRAILASRAK